MKTNKAFAVELIVVLAIVVFVNLVFSQLFARLDITENHIYSLSPVSKRIVKSLDDKVIIKCYFSKNIPAPYNRIEGFVRDKLDEYRAYGGDKIEYRFINPDESDDAQKEAQSYRIMPLQINAMEKDQMTLKRVYMGMVFLYGDKMETIPAISDVSKLEYGITALLKRMSNSKMPKIGYATGNGEPDIYTGLRSIRSALEGQYELAPVDLSSGRFPNDITTLVILAPRDTFTTDELYAIDQFLMYGGRLACFLDRVDVDLNTQRATPLNIGLADILAKYGARVNQDLVMDASCGQISVTRQAGMFQINTPVKYPYIPIVTSETGGLNPDNPITGDLQGIAFIFASSIDTAGARPEGVEGIWLAKTSDHSGTSSQPYSINPMEMQGISLTQKGIVLAYLMSGVFPSAYGSSAPSGASQPKPHKSMSDTTKIVVVGDGDFVTDKLSRNQTNNIFFLNVVDYLTSKEGEGLISIRSKQVQDRPLRETTAGVRTAIKILNIVLMPLLVVLYGLVRWQFSRRRRVVLG